MSVNHILTAAMLSALMLLPGDPVAAQDSATTVALTGVNVIPMTGAGILRDRTLIVEAGRIAEIGRRDAVEIPAQARVVDLQDKWIVPGLIDMHVHILAKNEGTLYLDKGITTVRNMWGWDLHLELRSEMRGDSLNWPRIVTSGRLLDGDPPRLRGSAALSSPVDARQEVFDQARAGYDGIKIYDGLDPDVFFAIMLSARRVNLPVWGHPPAAVGVDGILAAGIQTIEHLFGFSEIVTDTGDWEGHIDGAALTDLAIRIRESGTTVVPTMVTLEAADLSASEQEALIETDVVRSLPEPMISFCCANTDDPASDLPPKVRQRRTQNRLTVTGRLHDEGVRILVGSDTANRWVIPGDSYHDELQLLREAGLTPIEVLTAATRDAALELDSAADFGSLAVGLSADLLVLSENPLEEPDVLRNPEGVMLRGVWYRHPSQ